MLGGGLAWPDVASGVEPGVEPAVASGPDVPAGAADCPSSPAAFSAPPAPLMAALWGRSITTLSGCPLLRAMARVMSSHATMGWPSMRTMVSPACTPALAAGPFSTSPPTCGSSRGVPQPKARIQHRSHASSMLATGPAATTSRRCHAGRSEKLSSRVKPSGSSLSSCSPTRAT